MPSTSQRRFPALPCATFSLDEIVLALELTFFQVQVDDTHARIYTKSVDLLKDVRRTSDIGHERIADKVIDIYTVQNLPSVSAFKTAVQGLPAKDALSTASIMTLTPGVFLLN